MQPVQAKKRIGRPLLVAAVGIASVSYLGTIQGCADVEPADEEQQASASEEPGEVAETKQALTAKPGAIDTAVLIQKRLPPVGNLMPGPGGIDIGGGGGGVIVVPIPVGNLMVTPVDPIAVQPGTVVGTR